MPPQLGIQRPTLTGEILHLGRKVRAIPAQAMDEQELRRSSPGDIEGQLDAVTRELHGSSPYSRTFVLGQHRRDVNLLTVSIDYGRVEFGRIDAEVEPRMEAWVAFTAAALVFAAILALFVPHRQLLLLGIAAVAGIVASELFEWRSSQGVVQIIYLISALCVVSAILSYLWPWKAWQWGLMPFLADALWQVMGPYSTAHWGKLGPIPYIFPFYSAVLMAILPIIAAELAAYFTRRRQAKPT
jgi:MFS family permease